MLDHRKVRKAQLVQLYARRWNVELNLLNIKRSSRERPFTFRRIRTNCVSNTWCRRGPLGLVWIH